MAEDLKANPSFEIKMERSKDGGSDHNHTVPCTFTLDELVMATNNFAVDHVIGEVEAGRVYKGRLQSRDRVVAIKKLDQDGLRGFLVEVLMSSTLHHPNLADLIGYCADGDQRLLVFEYMPLGSLEDHLHGLAPGQNWLDWKIRMEIAAGVAKGLEYLHNRANPPVIYRNLKCSNILLDEGYHPKLCDFGLAKLGPVGGRAHVSTRVVGTYGYCAPEYATTGQLSLKSDVYSFGVVLLEIITGRKAIDCSRAAGEQSLVVWARSLLDNSRKFVQMVDPVLLGRYPAKGLHQALAVAGKCVEEHPSMRPPIADVATVLDRLASLLEEGEEGDDIKPHHVCLNLGV